MSVLQRVRHILFSVLLAALIAVLIKSSWFPQHTGGDRPTTLPAGGELMVENRLQYFEAKIIAGIHNYQLQHPDQASKMLTEFLSALFDNMKIDQVEAAVDRPLTAAKMLLLARYIGQDEAIETLRTAVNGGEEVKPMPAPALGPDGKPMQEELPAVSPDPAQNAGVTYRDLLIQTLVANRPDASVTLTDEARDWLRKNLDWFGDVFVSYYDTDQSRREAAAKNAAGDAEYAFQKVTIVTAVAPIILGAAVLSFFYLLFRFVRGSLGGDAPQIEISPWLLMETFTIYIGAMYLLPEVILGLAPYLVRLNVPREPMAINIAAILSIGIVALWPVVCGASFKQLRTTIGLRFSSVWRFISDIFHAPVTYLAAWLPLGLLMMIYALLLKFFDIDPSSGTHPIVPFLVENSDNTVLFRVIFLAVVVAPLIEELMFRGIFYSWLRTKLSAPAAIIISALIFASVHPQGAVGLLPLTYIGCVLAFLREWRGNLLSSMVAHACFNGGTMALLLFSVK